jgi:hypothetical protein
LDGLELYRTPRERIRAALLDLASLLGACSVAWSIGRSLVRMLASGGWLSEVIVCLLAGVIVYWLRWSSLARRFRIVIVLLLVAVGAGPFFT